MAFGDVRGTLRNNAASITNPFSATGSVVVFAGDLVYAVLGEQTSLTVTACADNLGNIYAATNAGTDAGVSTARAYWSRVSVPGTLTSVNFTATASNDNTCALAAVFAGPFDSSPLDANPANATDALSAFTCPATGTLAQAAEVVVAWQVAGGSTATSATSPNVLVGAQESTAAILHVVIGSQVVAATTTISPAFTAGSNPTDAVEGTTSFKQDLNLIQPNPTQYQLNNLYAARDALYPRTHLRNLSDTGGFDPSETARVRAPFFQKRSFYEPRTHNRNQSIPGTVVTVAGDQTLNPSLYSDPDTFYIPVVTLQEIPTPFIPTPRTLNRGKLPRRVNNTNILGFPLNQELFPSLYTDPDTFYTPVVTLQQLPAQNLVDPFINRHRYRIQRNSFSVSTPYSTINQNLQPSLYTDADTFYTPVVSLQELPSVNPIDINEVNRRRRILRHNFSIGTSYDSLTQVLTPSLFVNTNTFFESSVELIDVIIRPPTRLVRARQRFIRPNVSVSGTIVSASQDLQPSLYNDIDTFYTPVVTLQEIPTSYSPDARNLNRRKQQPRQRIFSVYEPRPPQDLAPSLYVDTDTFYVPIVTLQEIPTSYSYDIRTLNRRRPEPRQRIFSVVSPYPPQDLTPGLYTDADTFYAPSITLQEIPGQSIPDIRSLNRHRTVARQRIFSVGGYPPDQNLTPSIYTDADTFYVPVVSLQELPAASLPDIRILNRSRIQQRQRFPTVSAPYPATYNLTSSLYVDVDTFYTPVVSLQEIPEQSIPDIRSLNRRVRQVRQIIFSVSAPYPPTSTLLPSLYIDVDTFYTPVVASTDNLSPSLYIDPDTFYIPIVSLQEIPAGNIVDRRRRAVRRVFNTSISTPFSTINLELLPVLYVDDDTFYSPAIGTAGTIFPNLYVDDDTFYSPTVTVGSVNLAPNFYTDPDTFYAPIVTLISFVSRSPFFVRRLSHRRIQFNHSVSTPFSTVSQNLSPSLYVDDDTFYSPTVSSGVIDLRPSLYVDLDTFYAATITTGSVNLQPSLYNDPDAFYTPIITSRYNLFPSLYIDGDTFYSPSVIATKNLQPSLYTDPDAFYSPSIGGGTSLVLPSLYVNNNRFYRPTVVGPHEVPVVVFGGVGSPPPSIIEIVNVLVNGVLLTCYASIIPGHAETISLFSGDVEIDMTPILKPFIKDVRVRFTNVGIGYGDDLEGENLEDLLLIISETLLE